MSVIIHRTFTQGFSMLPNALLRDPAMSARARGVLVTLLSHEDGWQQSATYTEKEMTDGRYAIRAAIKELTDLGYIERERRARSGGKWQTDIHVYDTPNHAVSPQSVTPTSVEPTLGQTALSTKNPEGEEPLDVEPQVQSLAPARRRDELFETVAEVCNIDWRNITPSARGPLNKAVAELRGVGATPDEVRLRSGRWAWDVAMTPNGLAKHWPAMATVRAKASAKTRHGAALADQLEADGL